MTRPYDTTRNDYGDLRFVARLPGLDALGRGFAELLEKLPPSKRSNFPDAFCPEREVNCSEEIEAATDIQKRTFDWIETHQDEIVRQTAAAFAKQYADGLAVYEQMHATGPHGAAFPLPDPADAQAVRDLVRIGDLFLHPDVDCFGFELLFLATPTYPIGVQFLEGELTDIGVPDLAYAYHY